MTPNELETLRLAGWVLVRAAGLLLLLLAPYLAYAGWTRWTQHRATRQAERLMSEQLKRSGKEFADRIAQVDKKHGRTSR